MSTRRPKPPPRVCCTASHFGFARICSKALVCFRAGFFAGLLLGIGTVVGAAEDDQKIEKEFQASSRGKLIVQADRGSIEVNNKLQDGDLRFHRRMDHCFTVAGDKIAALACRLPGQELNN